MAISFDGTDQSAEIGNALSGIDNTVSTIGLWVQNGREDANDAILQTGSALSGSQNAFIVNTASPVSAGWRILFMYRWSSTIGQWTTDADLALDTWLNIVITYDRGSTANNPVIYVDGVSVALTEIATPSGSAKTGVDSIAFGSNVVGSQFADAIEAEAAIWNGSLDTDDIASFANSVSPLRLQSVPLVAYWPFLGDTEEVSGQGSGAKLTQLNTPTFVGHPPVAPQFGYDIDWPPAVVAAGTAALTGSVVPTVTERPIVTG